MKQGYYTLATKARVYVDVNLPLWTLILAAASLAEIWLARREKRWPGLVLPGLAFLRGMAKTILFYAACEPSSMALGAAVLEFVLDNIPTAVLLAVYAACREYRGRKRRRAQELDRTRIDDL